MQVPGQNHRDPWFPEFYKQCLEELKPMFGTRDGTTIIFPGTGTGGWESALTNTLSPGDKVVTFRYGLFSHLWIDMMQRLGLDVTVIDCRWGDGADEERCVSRCCGVESGAGCSLYLVPPCCARSVLMCGRLLVPACPVQAGRGAAGGHGEEDQGRVRGPQRDHHRRDQRHSRGGWVGG